MNERLWKHGQCRRLENRSRKDTISSHHKAGNNEGGYTSVSPLVSKPHPRAGFRPTGERKRENRGGGCVCGGRETLTDWLPGDLGQSLTLSPCDSGCIVSGRYRFPLSHTAIKKNLGFITVNCVNELQVREGGKTICIPDAPPEASKNGKTLMHLIVLNSPLRKNTIHSCRKHNTYYEIFFDATIYKQTVLRGKQASAI